MMHDDCEKRPTTKEIRNLIMSNVFTSTEYQHFEELYNKLQFQRRAYDLHQNQSVWQEVNYKNLIQRQEELRSF